MAIGLGGPSHHVSDGMMLHSPPLWSEVFGLVGALMTGFAMLILFKQQVNVERRLEELRSES